MFSRRSANRASSTTPLAGGCLSLFGLPFLAAGLFMSYLYFSGYVNWCKSQSWVEVPCQIETVESKNTGESSTETKATYRYRYEGKDYQGNRVSSASGADNVGSFQYDAYRELSGYQGKSKQFRCFVDTAHPAKSVLYRTLRWPLQAFMAIFVLTFPAVGAGLVVGGLLAIRETKKQALLQTQYPGEPWYWKPGWAALAIDEDASQSRTWLLAYTAWSAVVISPLLLTMLLSHSFTEPVAFAVLIFPALWCVPAWFALRRIRQFLGIGSVRFVPKASPTAPGGVLRGDLVFARPLPSRATVALDIFCEKSIITRDSDGSSTATEKLWSHRETISSDRMTHDLTGYRLPVQFTIPADAPESRAADTDGPKFAWKIQFQVPATAIKSTFEIPVFRTGAPGEAPVVATAAPLMAEIPSGQLGPLLVAQHIAATFNSAGSPESIICSPRRYLGAIVFLVIFSTIWSGVCVLILHQHAPLIFRVVFPGVGVICWVIALRMALFKRTVTFTGTGLEILNRLGPVSWSYVFPKDRIVAFSHDSNMRSGNTTYHRVRLESVLGKKQTLVDGITGADLAAALVTRLEAWKTPEHSSALKNR